MKEATKKYSVDALFVWHHGRQYATEESCQWVRCWLFPHRVTLQATLPQCLNTTTRDDSHHKLYSLPLQFNSGAHDAPKHLKITHLTWRTSWTAPEEPTVHNAALIEGISCWVVYEGVELCIKFVVTQIIHWDKFVWPGAFYNIKNVSLPFRCKFISWYESHM